jgi:uncharacterized damage-inducible protein DinB
MYRFSSIVRKKYLKVFEEIPWEDVVKDRGASYHSMRDVFVHVLDAYRYWFHYVLGGNDVKEYEDKDLDSIGNVEDMSDYEREVDGIVMGYVENMSEDELPRICTVETDNPDEQEASSISVESVLIHMIEEELQHRGELNCMMWQMDVCPPIGGLDDLLKAME